MMFLHRVSLCFSTVSHYAFLLCLIMFLHCLIMFLHCVSLCFSTVSHYVSPLCLIMFLHRVSLCFSTVSHYVSPLCHYDDVLQMRLEAEMMERLKEEEEEKRQKQEAYWERKRLEKLVRTSKAYAHMGLVGGLMSFCSTFVCYNGDLCYAFLTVVLVIYNYILFYFVIVISLVIIFWWIQHKFCWQMFTKQNRFYIFRITL